METNVVVVDRTAAGTNTAENIEEELESKRFILLLDKDFQKLIKGREALNMRIQSVHHSVYWLTDCRLNTLSHTVYWKSPISILGTAGYEIYIFLKKNG